MTTENLNLYLKNYNEILFGFSWGICFKTFDEIKKKIETIFTVFDIFNFTSHTEYVRREIFSLS